MCAGRTINLIVNRKKHSEPAPIVVYLHGGGMGVFTADQYDPVGALIALQGVVTVMVDFRNSTVAPFPAGLEDCYAALEYVIKNKTELGGSGRVIVAGESGGGNLSAAVALLAKERGLQGLDGQYLMCPFIGGCMDSPSWKAYDGLLLQSSRSSLLYDIYLTHESPAALPEHFAFPIKATVDQLRGLVPAIVVVNEFDPLYDEGAAARFVYSDC